jgi:hypothetical protein
VLDQSTESVLPVAERPFIENRLVGKALKFWESARGGRNLPPLAVLGSSDCPFDPDQVMVIEVGDGEESDRVVSAGSQVSRALGHDPTGLSAMEALPSSKEMGLSFCRASADLKKPLADVGRFFNRDGQEVLYRSILLPLSDDGEKVDRIVTAFSYKVVH